MPAWDTAQSEVALKYDPQQSNIQRQLDALKAQTAANETGLQGFGTAGRTGINDVYNTLNSLLTGNRATSAGEQQIAGQQIGNVYDTGAQYQSAVANASRSRLASLAQQVGAGAGGELQVLQPFEQQQQGIHGALQMAKANALENQKGWASRWDQILGQGINIGEQTRADRLAKFESELLNLLGQNKVTGLEGENELTGKLGDIMQARQNDLIASFERLQQQEWERSFQQAQLDQDAASKNASLAMQKYGIDAQSADSAASRAAANGFNWKDMMDATIAWEGAQSLKESRKDESKRGWADIDLRKQDVTQSALNAALDRQEAQYKMGNDIYYKRAGELAEDWNDDSQGDLNSLADNLMMAGILNSPGEGRQLMGSRIGNKFSTAMSLANQYPTASAQAAAARARAGAGQSGYTQPGMYQGGGNNIFQALPGFAQKMSSAFRLAR